ncbi:MAG: transposase [Ktedonobacterales bacterium]
MIPTPAQPTKHYGIGAVDYYTGETVVLLKRHKRRKEIAVRAAAGRLVLLYLPTYSPWLNPIEMLWRQFRREVTHNELFQTVKSLLAAARNFFDRYNQEPCRTLSVIGSHAQNVI